MLFVQAAWARQLGGAHNYVLTRGFVSLRSNEWIKRQRKDQHVKQARAEGWRSRAALKLIQLDDKLRLLQPGHRVVDLGGAPGGWAQVAARRVSRRKSSKSGQKSGGQVVTVDLQPMEPLPGVVEIQGDFTDSAILEAVVAALPGGSADLVMSDAAPKMSGDRGMDHARSMGLCEAALWAATAVEAPPLLAPGGDFLVKATQGGSEKAFSKAMKPLFDEVKFVKPPASRNESREVYICGRRFRRPTTDDGHEGGA